MWLFCSTAGERRRACRNDRAAKHLAHGIFGHARLEEHLRDLSVALLRRHVQGRPASLRATYVRDRTPEVRGAHPIRGVLCRARREQHGHNRGRPVPGREVQRRPAVVHAGYVRLHARLEQHTYEFLVALLDGSVQGG